MNEYARRFINFNRSDGVYTNEMLREDFGNGCYPINRGFASIESNCYKITFNKGMKVNNTGAAVQISIPSNFKYTLEYCIKYDINFQKGLQGKQCGFVCGVGYDGGRGEQARNGDGGSVRLQFDSHDSTISNQLYTYYADMVGDYGNNPGDQKFYFNKGEWNKIRMTVSLNEGRIEVWCNNIKHIDVKDIAFVKVEDCRFIKKLSFESFPGGGGITPQKDNFVYVNNFEWFE
jgi:hypothetical protein